MSYPRSRLIGVLCSLFALSLICASSSDVAVAQVTESQGSNKAAEQGLSDVEMAALAGKLAPDERMALLARLSDSQVRELLILQLDRATAARTEQDMGMTATMVGGMQSQVHVIRDNLRNILAQVKNLPTVFPFAIERLTEGRDKTHLLWVLLEYPLERSRTLPTTVVTG